MAKIEAKIEASEARVRVPTARERDAAVLFDLCTQIVAKAGLYPEAVVRTVVDMIHAEVDGLDANGVRNADRAALLSIAEALLAITEEG